MIQPEKIASMYGLNTRILMMQTEGLTNADSFLQPPFRANCLNWVLGHILDSRQIVLELLGGEVFLTAEQRATYQRESEPLTAASAHTLSLADLLAQLERASEQIAIKLNALSLEEWSAPVGDGDSPKPLSELVFFQYFHDTYHTGQTELLRQLAGKNDKVI